MKLQEYIAKFLGDLAKIVFGTVVIGQIFAEKTNILQLITASGFMLALLGLSIFIYPED